MERTPEQVAADNALDEAIRRCADAYEVVADGEVVSSWVVAGAAQGADDDRSAYFTLSPGGTQPGFMAYGLLAFAADHLLHNEGADDG